jgi:sugar phosphate isomerase/epimerase
MNLSIATATFYHVPFKETLEIIKKAGFEYIELDIYWKGGDNWEAGQHLKSLKPRDVLKMVKESGLKISSLHDIGGVVYSDNDSLISFDTYQYLEYGVDDIPCVVFHTPHKKTDDIGWWEKYKEKAGSDLQALKGKSLICIENMSCFDGYQVPLINPTDMLAFSKENQIFVNIDTTHYAEAGIDIVQAADILKDYVKSIHLSDFKYGKTHLYIGEGDLDFKDFFNNLYLDNLHAITLECNIPYDQNNPNIAVQSMRKARNYLENIIG